ncbi:MAG: hypothetical protein ABIM74_03690 [candidate division WOR-3 bacterium]
MKKLLFGFVLVGFLAGCATIVIDAPPGADNTVSLTSQPSGGSSYHFVAKKKVWYILWGLIPITDNHTADLVAASAQGKPVRNLRATTTYTFVDWLLSVVLNIIPTTIQVKSVIVEGDVVK